MITLVLDLDETLVHSLFRKAKCDYRLKITVDGNVHKVYVK
jgi:TFIIF-interacting CTD phosphatase-like protein